MKFFVCIFICFVQLLSCNAPAQTNVGNNISNSTSKVQDLDIITGADQFEAYQRFINGKNIGLCVNHTSILKTGAHLIDDLKNKGQQIEKIFTPEHGLKGTADAGEKVYNDFYKGIAIHSLYGKNKKPSKASLEGIDILIFDMQDVGTRFYTYISTMHYVMEAAAEHNIPVIVLDRPNPNGHFVDGPIREEAFKSFVGMHPIPVVHGMTVGELANMINGEQWLNNGIQCDLTVIPCLNYTHHRSYELPVKPSPNLPNMKSIYLYPSLCFFEGTEISIGRGTNKQFQLIGHPSLPGEFTFTPKSGPGSKYPKLENQLCRGKDLSSKDLNLLKETAQINLGYLIDAYNSFPDKQSFFLKNGFFDKLAGTTSLRNQIIAGKSESEIREGWKTGLQEFEKRRTAYLLYP